MTGSYTLKQLTEVEDSAIKFGMGDVQEARFCKDDLGGLRGPVLIPDLLDVKASPADLADPFP